jgi:acetate kinase
MTAALHVLVLNAGSSTLKYRLVRMPDESTIADGTVERLSGAADHEAAVTEVIRGLETEPDVVGHRVVHGGDFDRPVIVDDAVEARIESFCPLAPLHNPVALTGIRTARRQLPTTPQVAVFDTAFHATLPAHARTYAIDAEVAGRFGIRRYGFHGISFSFVSRRAAEHLDRPLAELRMIVLHLGNGASAAAIRDGRSIDTSMGFTPVEGLVMGTRPGDLDAAIPLHLQRSGGFSLDDVEDLLQHRSGLAGLTGHSDMRDVLAEAGRGSAAAALAIDVYAHRLRHYIGAYAAQLGGIDALVFTAGVGENNPVIRARAVEGLDFLGLAVDQGLNEAPGGDARTISPAFSPASVLVVPTDEAREIARASVDATHGFRG